MSSAEGCVAPLPVLESFTRIGVRVSLSAVGGLGFRLATISILTVRERPKKINSLSPGG
jgi:hypothetical protein